MISGVSSLQSPPEVHPDRSGLADHPHLSSYWKRSTSQNLDESSDDTSNIASSRSTCNQRLDASIRTLDRRSVARHASFEDLSRGQVVSKDDGAMDEIDEEDGDSSDETIEEELDHEEQNNFGLLPCSDNDEDEDIEEDLEAEQPEASLAAMYLQDLSMPSRAGWQQQSQHRTVTDQCISQSNLSDSIRPLEGSAAPLGSQVVFSTGRLSKVVSTTSTFEDICCRLESELDERLVISYQGGDRPVRVLTSDFEFRQILKEHSEAVRAQELPSDMMLCLTMQSMSQKVLQSEMCNDNKHDNSQYKTLQSPSSQAGSPLSPSPCRPKSNSTSTFLLAPPHRLSESGPCVLDCSGIPEESVLEESSLWLPQRTPFLRGRKPASSYAIPAAMPRSHIGSAAYALDGPSNTARMRSTSSQEPSRSLHSQLPNRLTLSLRPGGVELPLGQSCLLSKTTRCSKRTGIAAMAVQSSARRPIKDIHDGGKFGLTGRQARARSEEKVGDEIDSSGGSDSQSASPAITGKGRPSLVSSAAPSLFGTGMPASEPIDQAAIVWAKGKKLGSGAFGSVFSALDLRTGLHFAIKQVLMGGTAGSTTRKKQGRALQREVYYLEGLSHPNIVRILGTHRTTQKLTIFLEYASDGSLAQMVSEFGPLSEGIIRSYTRQILAGLRYLHRNRIIHRDIKPANILIDKGQVKLADFGASKRLDEEVIAHGLQGVTGTLLYMAPEVLQSVDGGGYGRRSDIWSLGVTLIELAYARHPFESLDDALVRACEPLEAMPNLPDFFSEDAHDFLDHCLARAPEDRWSAAKLRRHNFNATSEDIAVVERYQPSRSSRTGRSWLPHSPHSDIDEDGGSPDASESAAMHSMINAPFQELDKARLRPPRRPRSGTDTIERSQVPADEQYLRWDVSRYSARGIDESVSPAIDSSQTSPINAS